MRASKYGGSVGALPCQFPSFSVLFVTTAGALVSAVLVNRVVRDPYMDEIFHIPQAQQFCRGDFGTWNPMITTLPGLYLTSVGFAAAMLPVARLINLASNIEALCSVAVLRSVNMVLGFVCCLLFHQIVRQIEPGVSSPRASAKVLAMALYPLHWFFSFLYYTDVGSTTAVMAMYLASLRRAYWISALVRGNEQLFLCIMILFGGFGSSAGRGSNLGEHVLTALSISPPGAGFGAVSIMFRQTNIVWTIFATCVGLLDVLEGSSSQKDKQTKNLSVASELRYNTPHVSDGGMRKRSPITEVAETSSFCSEFENKQGKGFMDDCQDLVVEACDVAKLVWLNRYMVVWNFSPLLGVISAFFLFVLYNGGIVVGAKEAHTVSAHFPQVLYFGLTTAAILSPIYLSPTTQRKARVKQKPLNKESFVGYVLAFGLAVVSVHYFTYAHPYLLADNRHYTFYLWRKIFSAHWSSKYLLLPAYMFSWSCILHGLGKTKTRLWILTFLLAVGGVLVPTPLFEFRYYTVPFFITFLHSHADRNHGSLEYFLIGAGFLVVNVATMYIFLFRPFEWAHERGVQRFMW